MRRICDVQRGAGVSVTLRPYRQPQRREQPGSQVRARAQRLKRGRQEGAAVKLVKKRRT